MVLFTIQRQNTKIEKVFKAQSLQTFISLSHSKHSFGEINALLTTLTKSDLWLPNSWYIYQTEKSWDDFLNTFS